MPLTVGELARIKSRDPYLYEVLTKIVLHVNTMQKQMGIAPSGQLPAPPAIGGISVTAANGWFDVAITDKGVVQPGIEYFVEWDTSSNFSNARVVPMQSSRNKLLNLGNQTLYFRGYSQYKGSLVSQIVPFGSPPTAVVGGGATAPPAPQPTQGSGTSQVPGRGFGTPPNQIPGQRNLVL
jgi:hypothetical protein